MQSFSQEIFNLYVPSSGLISGLRVSDRRVGDVRIVDLSGSFSRGFGLQFFDERVRHLVQEGARNLAIDLEHVSEIDSSGFGALAVAHNWVEQAGGQIKLFAASERVKHTLIRLHFDKVFEIVDDQDAVLRAFGAPASEQPESLAEG
ncbi:MAG TPA: STAS domain-containing protein [Terriglobia bacterium]|nr:STAS domain-containing protein [Terriglobia bacterium]